MLVLSNGVRPVLIRLLPVAAVVLSTTILAACAQDPAPTRVYVAPTPAPAAAPAPVMVPRARG